MKLKLRPAQDADINFVLSTWIRGFYYGNAYMKLVDKDAYYRHYPETIKSIISNSQVLVACFEDDEDIAIGYCVFQNTTLHWLYVKSAFRGRGVGKSLLPEGIQQVSHITKPGDAIRKKKNWKLNPWGN